MRVHLPAKIPAPAKPLTETPTIYLYDAEAQSGPFDLFQIQQMVSQGAVTSQALYWSEGMTEWRSVSELAGGVAS